MEIKNFFNKDDENVVNFQRILRVQEVKDLFEYFARNSIEVHYRLEYKGITKYSKNKFVREENISHLEGIMFDSSKRGRSIASSFECLDKYKNGEVHFGNFKFASLPRHVNGEEKKLLVKIKGLTDKYFSEKKE